MNRNTTSGKTQFGDFVFGKTLGQGTFGKVKIGKHKITGESVAIKILEKSKINDTADTERVLREIHILKLMRHPNIVQLYDIGQTNKKLFLFMEFMEKGELFNYIVKNHRLREDQACRLFHQLLDGIEHLHKIGIVHRDLKPENLLLDYRMNLRIVDFGLSNTYKKNQTLKTPCGSPCYAAPEMLNGQAYHGLQVDTWSAGVILFAMLCGHLPFEDDGNTNALYKKILAGDYKIRQQLSEPAKDLIRKIVCVDPHKRYTIDQIRKHPWMTINCPNRSIAHGIVIGYNKIPIDNSVLSSLKTYNYDLEHTRNCIQANRHNNNTTTYYLALKKFIKNGGITPCDFSGQNFDPSLLDPVSNQRRKQQSKGNLLLIESFFTGSGRQENRKKSKQNLREKTLMKSKGKQNRDHNNHQKSRQKNTHSQKIISNSKKIRTQSKVSNKLDPRIENSINYGRPSTGKSNQKPKRQSLYENRLSRKYKQKFNQSLVSKSKDKISHQVSNHNTTILHYQPPKANQRSRVESSILHSKHRNEPSEVTEMINEVKIGKRRSLSKKVVSQSIHHPKARWM